MIELQGFWSYVHDDDQAEKGRIMRLAEDIKAEYELQTGDNLLLFVDKNDLKWGEAWRTAIDSKLNSVAFFIPVITPRFFLSSECCRELREFASNAKSQGIPNLVLPILYAKGPEFDKKDNEDELIQLIKSLQWKDWTELRFKDVGSEEYRRAVADIASSLIEANKNFVTELPDADVEHITLDGENYDNLPGIIDTLAIMEEVFPQIPVTLYSITENLKQIDEITKSTINEIQISDSHGGGNSAKLMILRRTAVKYIEPTEEIFTQSNLFSSQIQSVNPGVRNLIDQWAIAIKENLISKEKVCIFFNEIKKLNQSASFAKNNLQLLMNKAESLIKLSRDLRPSLRKLQRACTILIESSSIIDEWANQVDFIGIDCSDT